MPYFVPHKPTSGETSTYNRRENVFFWTATPFEWTWRFAEGTPEMSPWPAVRLLVDGVPATDWVSPATNAYVFTLSPADGHHIVAAEISPDVGLPVLGKPFVVNTTGGPLEEQTPWISVNRFDLLKGVNDSAERLVWPGDRPTVRVWPLKPRDVQSYGEFLTFDKLWVRRVQSNFPAATIRRWASIPTGDVVIEADQKYFYGDAINKGLEPPIMTLQDGPRGLGTLGSVYKVLRSPGNTGWYMSDTAGRLSFMWDDGRVATLAGWRVKPGELKAHAGLLSNLSMYYGTPQHAANRAFYDSKWEYVADFSRAGDLKMHEPWGFAAHGDDLGFHEFWIADTLNNRIVYVNHYTAHSAASYHLPDHPPLGYTAPDQPTGQSHAVTFLDGPLVNEPWDCAIHDGRLYWTNFAGNQICRANLDGTNPEIVFDSSVKPTDAQLGISVRLGPGLKSSVLRQTYLIDGPAGSCVRPQAMAFDSQGRLLWAERYLYAIRRLDLSTGVVETVVLLPIDSTNSGSSSPQDIAMAVDALGECGPVDNIAVATWRGDYRYASDGTNLGRITFSGSDHLSNGPLQDCFHADYAWGLGVGKGRTIVVGSAGGSQCLEITKRLPSDPSADVLTYRRGKDSFHNALYLTHGPWGQGELGFPTVEELGSYDDDTLRTYLTANGVGDVEAAVYFVRQSTVDQDYSAAPPPPPPPPPGPTKTDALAALEVARQYIEGT